MPTEGGDPYRHNRIQRLARIILTEWDEISVFPEWDTYYYKDERPRRPRRWMARQSAQTFAQTVVDAFIPPTDRR